MMVARISPEKGIKEGIKLFARLAEQIFGSRLVIAGDTVYERQRRYQEECRRQVRILGVEDRVQWVGQVEDATALLRGCIGFIHLPLFEDPFPTTIMEALIADAPIITTRKGGIPEQVSGFNGVYYAEEWSPAELAASLVKGEPINRANEYERRFGWKVFQNAVNEVAERVVTED